MEEKKPSPNAAPRENKMGVMPIGRLLAGMAVPMMISMLVQAFYNVVDSIFVAQLSEDALNAVSLAFPLQNLMIAVGAGTAEGINALLSRSLGEKNQTMADRAANTGIFLSLCSFVVFALIGVLFSRTFFEIQAAGEPIIVEYGTEYATICLGLSIGIFSQFCFERLLQSTGRTTLAMVTQLTGAVINIIMDPILIFGYFGFPRMEVAGAAAATVLGQIVAAIMAVVMNLKWNPDVNIRLREIRWNGHVAGEIYRVGFPSIVMQSIGSVMVFGMNKILFGFTKTATAVFGAYFKLQSFVFMPNFGINNGMVPIIGYNYGARQPKRITQTIKLAVCFAECIMLCGLFLAEVFPHVLLGVFNASPTMLAMGILALRIIAIHFPMAGFNVISSSAFQALGRGTLALLVSVIRQLVVLVPAAWLLSHTGNVNAVWFAFPIAELVAVTLCAVFMRKCHRDILLPMEAGQKTAASV